MAHCKTCTCEPATGWDITVYPANATLYGRCETCEYAKWRTDRFDLRTRNNYDARHCGCCTHQHNLAPGGHYISEADYRARKRQEREWQDSQGPAS